MCALHSVYHGLDTVVYETQRTICARLAGANQIVRRLVEIGILQEITGHTRHRRFRYEPYVRLFDEQ